MYINDPVRHLRKTFKAVLHGKIKFVENIFLPSGSKIIKILLIQLKSSNYEFGTVYLKAKNIT